MTVFWIAAIVATVLVLALLVLPLARKPKGDNAPARAQFDLTVYKDQLVEVDRDLERGVLSADQALAARTEIERRMLAAAGEDDAPSATPATHNPRLTSALLVALLVVVPLGAFGLYYTVGNPGMGDHPLAGRVAAQGQPMDTADRDAQISAMIKDIKTRLEKEPNNPRNWNVLGQAYEMQGKLAEAVGAYQNLVAVTDRHADALVILAEAMFVEAGQVVTPAAAALFKEARTQDPSNPMTYYYVALERQQADDLQGAMDEYAGLLSVSPSNGGWVADIQGRMTALAGEMGVEVPVVQMLPPMDQTQAPMASGAPAAGGPGPSAAQVQQAQEMAPEEQQAMIRSMVARLAAKMKDNPDDLVGWKRLAQAYKVLGDAAGQAEAAAQIKRLSQ